jgi:hypothetical protein
MKKFVIIYIGLPREESVFSESLRNVRSVFNPLEADIFFFPSVDRISSNFSYILNQHLVKIIPFGAPSMCTLSKYDPLIGFRSPDALRKSGGLSAGSLWIQVLNWDFALSYLSSIYSSQYNPLVVKLRTDVVLSEDKLLELKSLKLNPVAHDDSITHKIWTPYISRTSLFYICDIVFSGFINDLRIINPCLIKKDLVEIYPPKAHPSFFWLGVLAIGDKNRLRFYYDYFSSKNSIHMVPPLKLAKRYRCIVENLFIINSEGVRWKSQWGELSGILPNNKANNLRGFGGVMATFGSGGANQLFFTYNKNLGEFFGSTWFYIELVVNIIQFYFYSLKGAIKRLFKQ